VIETGQAKICIWTFYHFAGQLVLSMGIVAELTITAMEVSNLPTISPFDVVPAELSLVVLLALNGGFLTTAAVANLLHIDVVMIHLRLTEFTNGR
jgi:hypothetical protein